MPLEYLNLHGRSFDARNNFLVTATAASLRKNHNVTCHLRSSLWYSLKNKPTINFVTITWRMPHGSRSSSHLLPDNMAQNERRGDRHRKTHGTCNELHIRLKCLHKLVQLSCLFLVGGRQYLCLMITGELRIPWEERGDCRFEASSTCRIMPPA